MKLTKSEIKRYSRHLLLSEVGVEGQLKLKKASVLIVGLGGLGSPLAMYLAASGVGRLGLIDNDVVDESNLQRQIIHGTSDVGRLKNDSAIEKLKEINPEITLKQYNEALTSKNAMGIIADYDIVADGTDNFQTRYLVNDACVLLGKPNVYGSVYRFEGQASVFWAKKTIDFAFETGVDNCTIIPVRAGNGTMEILQKNGDFSPPTINSLETVLDYGISINKGRVFADTWDLHLFSSCNNCINQRTSRLTAMNHSQSIASRVACMCDSTKSRN